MNNVIVSNKIRVSIFCDPVNSIIEGASTTGADRIELYTEAYAKNYHLNKENAIKDYIAAAKIAHTLGLGINAGHDLDLENLNYFNKNAKNVIFILICVMLFKKIMNLILRCLK